jgi:MYXO-CTERM domain-containing protein
MKQTCSPLLHRAVVASLMVMAATNTYGDITVNFANLEWTGFNFSDVTASLSPNEITGTFTGATINVTLNASANNTYANDLAIYVDLPPLSTGGFLQLGGVSNLGAPQRYSWPNGGNAAPGTTSIGTVNFTTPLNFTGNPAVDGTIWVGNGNGAGGTSGTWTGTLILHGINSTPLGATPVPEVSTLGAGGLLGAGAFWALRRRQRIQQSGNA